MENNNQNLASLDELEKDIKDIKILLYGILLKSTGSKASENATNRIINGFKYKMNLVIADAEKELKMLKDKNKPKKIDLSGIPVETRNEPPKG